MEPPLPKKKRCYGLKPSAGPSRTIIPLMDLEIPVPRPSGVSLTPKVPATASSGPDTPTSAALPVQPATSKAPEIALPDLNKVVALSESDKDSVYDRATLVSKLSKPAD